MPYSELYFVCTVSNCCLSLYLNVGGLQEGTGKRFLRFCKVL